MYHKLYDRRVNCISVLIEMKLGDYLDLVDDVYSNAGGIEGQRGPLKTKTGITIRKRLVDDIKHGAVMPPVVLGVFLADHDYEEIDAANDAASFMAVVQNNRSEGVSVIDGMQRTTAMSDAAKSDPTISSLPIRVEFWVSNKLSSLIYRMLVLNTGQVPWEIGRQLETIYSQFLRRIRDELGPQTEVFLIDTQRRRVQAGQYQSKNIIELLLLFSSRKVELDIKDRVAEDFARLDAIETTSHSEFLDYFIESLRLMAQLDKQFSRLTYASEENARIRSGKDIFSSFPAMAGFCAAIAIEAFDEPGFPIVWPDAEAKLGQIATAVGQLVTRLAGKDEAELEQFLQLQLLEERLSQRSGQVGRFEREFFRRAFAALFRNSDRLEDMTPCWMA